MFLGGDFVMFGLQRAYICSSKHRKNMKSQIMLMFMPYNMAAIFQVKLYMRKNVMAI